MVSSSGSTQLQSPNSERDPVAVMAQRKQKRMQSNRESARRSRMRKQKHLDDLMAQVNHLRKENSQVLAALNVTTQHCLGIETENSVLRTQMIELRTRLQSLNEILHHMIGGEGGSFATGMTSAKEEGFLRPWSPLLVGHALLASDVFQYC